MCCRMAAENVVFLYVKYRADYMWEGVKLINICIFYIKM